MKYLIAVIDGIERHKKAIDRLIDRAFDRLQNSKDPFGNMIVIAIVAMIVVSAGIFGLNYYTGTLR